MKTLLLVRHAKSSWDDPAHSDFERPLNKRGFKDAPFMSKKIKEFGLNPDLMISSPANRALTTAIFFAEEFVYPEDNIINNIDFYEKNYDFIFNIIKKIDNQHNTVFIFSHNPTVSYLSQNLTKSMLGEIPTCGVVCIDFNVELWNEIEYKQGILRFFEYPKKYIR